MKKTYIYILSIFIFFSCNKGPCPEFPVHLLEYGKEQTGDQISFKNDQDQIVNITTKSFWRAPGYEPTCTFCQCFSDAGFETRTQGINVANISFSFSIAIDGENADLRYAVGDNEVTDTFIYSVSETNPFDENNEKCFGDTVNIEIDSFRRFDKVTAIKGIGLYEIHDTKLNTTWTRVIK